MNNYKIHPYYYPGLDYKDFKSINEIVTHICFKLKIDIKDFTSSNRKDILVYSRIIFANLCKKNGFTHVQIGNFINRDHSTITHYIKEFEKIEYNPKLKKFMQLILN
jgi:chromosomal replication initiation ATPase DnaA